ncbi:MAG: ribonuclease III [Deltaproteobacteria bacterium CG_4_8_14_3_um_filter_51_11]|nr:ribonuclease III [bacterium]OIP40406.1 MAG: ribonuclease III [Desulfobacteraceae bacterium CG2_30_51_40]PIP44900.1 MAG: ribonuclease III [Deltaproteobacteria bacterium CG23_combo_of_CG06-09_8_20_14_all_51_20]PIX18784.1 MAG: ribonuclease III [Deltaproteobacteria bacterium CG_4_8_14_3_um_filter_51_11]PIY26906.1 MAG: ribonuclease III [Deltaproteobacteria bacterium CG_4_10_14_3_um_filter_51_14]PJB35307.1 MAG: ribonuclease III [Deltaproteobacteria bacterium CG_4_9_14_3_um_filter_51_14]
MAAWGLKGDYLTEEILKNLYNEIGYEFRNPEMARQAFRHSSFVHENPGDLRGDNERLEFLGDAVLDLAVGHMLMNLLPEAREGELSKLRASVVSENGLSRAARELRLGEMILLGKGEEASGGKDKPSIMADTLEALIGAVYLDGGLDNAMVVIERIIGPLLRQTIEKGLADDSKSLLQEYTQQNCKSLPAYHLLAESGPPHDKTFRVSVWLSGRLLAEGIGKSKKEAEQEAAKEAYSCLINHQ